MNEVLSPCHEATVIASLGDGVLIGSCSVCYTNIVRTNLRTGLVEWLDGNSPWTTRELRALPDEFQNPKTLAFQPALSLKSPCHELLVRYVTYLENLRVGICSECNSIFARINPLTGRIEKVEDELKVDFTNLKIKLPEFPRGFQPLQL